MDSPSNQNPTPTAPPPTDPPPAAPPPATPPPAAAPAGAGQATPEAQLVADLKDALAQIPGVAADLIGGATVAEIVASVKASVSVYQTVRAQVLKDLGAQVPAAHAVPGATPAPSDPFGMIQAGLAAGNAKH